MTEQPLVSVLMTAYNREKYITEAIESVLNSTYTNFELIIVDDGSKDDTVKIAKRYEERDKRIKVYVNEKNLGDYPNRNKATSYANGEFIMFVDSDDMILQDGIKKCAEIMLLFPESSIGMYSFNCEETAFLLNSEQAIQTHFFKRSFLTIGPGATIIRRSFFEKIGKYPEKYGPANDMYFNLKAVCFSSIVMLPFEFMYYRRHEGQGKNNTYSYLYNNYRYIKDALKGLPLPITDNEKKWLDKKNKRRFSVNLFKYFFKTFNLSKTRNAIKQTDFSMKDALQGIFH